MKTDPATVFDTKITTPLKKKGSAYLAEITKVIDSGDYSQHEAALYVAHDTRYQNAIQKALQPYGDVRHVVLVGIGGSSLGTEAVYHALRTPESPSLLVIDAIEPSTIAELAALLKKVKDPKRIAFVIISKSGTTTETVLNADRVLSLVDATYGAAATAQVIAIGDEDSALIRVAKKRKVRTFVIPKAIGGRYSVFTAAGMVPLTLLGIDIAELRAGACEALSHEHLDTSLEAATILAAHAQIGFHTLNYFTFEKRLATLGYWYRQLLAESLGKPRTKKGKKFACPLLPTVSTSIDLHSVGQLYLGGYEGIYTKFVYTDDVEEESPLGVSWASELVPLLKGKTPGAVKHAITDGVLRAYDEASLPYETIAFGEVNAHTVGFVLAQHMLEVMLVCAMFDVDAFDQPNVESYKKHVRSALDA